MKLHKGKSLRRQRGFGAMPLKLLLAIHAIGALLLLAFGLSFWLILKLFKRGKVAVALVMLTAWAGLSVARIEVPEHKVRRYAASRTDAIAACRVDLQAVSAPIPVDSILLEAGVAHRRMFLDLIGNRGLAFVEFRARTFNDRRRPPMYGVSLYQGDERSDFKVPAGVQIVRLFLAPKGDEHCTSANVMELSSELEGNPFSPNACLRVDLDEKSRASHTLKAVPAGDRGLIKWTVMEQASGTTLAALTSNDDPSSPVGQKGGHPGIDLKQIGDGTISCLEPYFSMMELFHAPPDQSRPRLALGRHQLILPAPDVNADTLPEWISLTATEETITSALWGKFASTATSGQRWAAAYDQAEQTGWGPYQSGLIDLKAGEVIEARINKQVSLLRPQIRGAKEGFLVVWPKVKAALPVAHYSRDGLLLGKWQVPCPADFDLVGMEWMREGLTLFGFVYVPGLSGVEIHVLKVTLPKTR